MLDIQGSPQIIKQALKQYLGKTVQIKYNLGRNKTETYNVIIKSLYSYIFITETVNTHTLKSFSYADIITKTIKIYEKNTIK